MSYASLITEWVSACIVDPVALPRRAASLAERRPPNLPQALHAPLQRHPVHRRLRPPAHPVTAPGGDAPAQQSSL
eukprot:CAMPEP_0172557876 /NCGR_PEP_ID=MMETSP1067-20121228/75885_1 /TAXON_ID=265564 ORGANISM="Thalassiosira punctigera, Strain Tpunct2005C2" /NCGR_SAMPLE_ID=MMETSP1067 /ASSEMBLY_ACC=CAM_ASM_000444 /LENGTH=74 /DNA_ID=CAMNT_0013347083 /DNA_START=26 /DNA_END=247 /DNA_ORIENTATION=-